MSALLERDKELATLLELLDRLETFGEGAIVLVEGVAGIGKSSLLEALVGEARGRRGVHVLSAKGTELEFELAFGGTRQLLSPAVFALDDSERDRVFAGPAALAGSVLGLYDAGTSGQVVDPLYGLYWLVSNLAERGPVLLAVDDAHWLDAESLRFVAYLAQRLEGLSVLLAVSARPSELAAVAGPLEALKARAVVVSPPPLSARAVGSLVGDPDRAAEAQRVTGGNPFLVAELGRMLAQAPMGAALDELGSAAVAQWLTARIQRISTTAVAIADAVALFPAGATLADAAWVARVDRDAAAEAADALVAAQVVTADHGTLAFLHPLMRSALYDALGPFARRRGHRAAAEALRARGVPAEQVAAHLLEGEPAGDPDNVAILRAAADTAMARIAPRAAVRYLERALAEGALVGEPRLRLLLDTGRLQRQLGDPKARATLTSAFDTSASSSLRVEAAIELAAFGFVELDYRLVSTTVAAMADCDMGADDRLALDMLLAESAWNADDHRACLELIGRVPPDLPGTTPAQRLALVMSASVRLFACEPIDDVVDVLRRAVGPRGADALVAGVDIGDPLGWLISCDALDDAEALAEQRQELAHATGNEALFAECQRALGWVAEVRGDLPRAEALFRLGLESPALTRSMRLLLVLDVVEVLILRGLIDDAAALLSEAEHLEGRLRTMRLRRAELATLRGDFAEALPLWERRRAEEDDLGIRHPGLRWWTQDYLDCLAALGRRDEAIAYATDLVELSERTGGVSARGMHRLTLGRLTADIEELEAAHAILEPSPFRWEAARARLELGEALRRAGRRVEARDHLRAALDYGERNGVVRFAVRARDELRLTGARPRRAVLTGADALTGAEARIATLAAQGRSNKDIAQHLFVTVKTVEMNLTRAYRKLEVHSRHDLPQALAGTRRHGHRGPAD